MKKLLKSMALALAILSTGAQATSFATDTSDIWYNPNESGWGLGVTQQNDILFVVLYVYGANGQATWYYAPRTQFTAVNASGTVYSGPFYQATGSPYAQGFNPAAGTSRQVGTASFTLTNLTTAVFTYSIDGFSASKSVTRQTWATNNMSGNFLGGRVGTYSGCPAGGASGYLEEPGTWAVQHNTTGAQLTFSGASTSCTYDGGYAQSGHFGLVSGNFSCTNGQAGAFQAYEINAQVTALAGRITTNATNGCVYDGRLAGARRTP
ncbi:hypothetical protein BWI17_18885 [Betaproteobacteria bacterium GR16-43]|nr:hypothetical protein BWI17_18885 [Betaproteobacteria bacterium GR16-43]